MIKSLTSLRGIFILFIFFHHCLDIYPGGGTMAVTFFFVLSGFSLTLGYKDRVLQPEFCYTQYITRRCIKFYPLHWLCLLSAAIPVFITSFTGKKILLFLLNASLLQTWVPIKEIYFSFNMVSWFLADTMFFALAFPFLLKVIVKSNSLRKVCIAFFVALIYVTVVLLIPREQYHAILYISPYMRLADFVLGIFLALGYLRMKENRIEIRFLNNKNISFLLFFGLIAMLVLESCVLTTEFRRIAPVYWILVSALIMTTSLTDGNGGGQIYGKQIHTAIRRT